MPTETSNLDFNYAKQWLNYTLGDNYKDISEDTLDDYINEWMISPSGFNGDYTKIGPYEILIDLYNYAELQDKDIENSVLAMSLYKWCEKIMENCPANKIPVWQYDKGGMKISYIKEEDWN